MIFLIFINYIRSIEKLVKGHLERAEIESIKLATSFSTIYSTL
jgi:hypothetical protein